MARVERIASDRVCVSGLLELGSPGVVVLGLLVGCLRPGGVERAAFLPFFPWPSTSIAAKRSWSAWFACATQQN